LDPSFNIMDMWKTRFSKTGRFLRIFYEDLMNTYKGKAIQDLLVYNLTSREDTGVWMGLHRLRYSNTSIQNVSMARIRVSRGDYLGGYNW